MQSPWAICTSLRPCSKAALSTTGNGRSAWAGTGCDGACERASSAGLFIVGMVSGGQCVFGSVTNPILLTPARAAADITSATTWYCVVRSA